MIARASGVSPLAEGLEMIPVGLGADVTAFLTSSRLPWSMASQRMPRPKGKLILFALWVHIES